MRVHRLERMADACFNSSVRLRAGFLGFSKPLRGGLGLEELVVLVLSLGMLDCQSQ